MDISIIIVNLNTRQLLEACLHSIVQHCHDVSYEIIVVDNHSSDDSVAMVKRQFPQAHVIENAVNNRYALANNQGLALAQGKYVLYLNSDIVVRGRVIQEMYQFLEQSNDAGVVGGRLVFPDEHPQDSCFRFPSAVNLFYLFCLARFYWDTPLAGNYRQQHFRTATPVDFVVGACFMARRELLLQCAGMDADYYLYGEDSDLCYRIRQLDRQVYYLPTRDSIVHYGGASTLHLLGEDHQFRQRWGWKSRFVFTQKHYPFWKKLLSLFAMLNGFAVNILWFGLVFLKRRDWVYIRKHLAFHWDILRDALHIIHIW